MRENQGTSRNRQTFTLAALGDVILSRAPHDPENPVFEAITAADVACGNLEFTLTENRSPSEKLIALRAEPQITSAIADWGVDVLSLANNHAMDFGSAGLFDSLAAVKAAGMASVGAGETLEASLQPHIREIGGNRIAFFGVSTHLPGGSAAGDSRPGIAPVRVSNRYAIDPITLQETPGMAPYVQTEIVRDDQDRLCSAIAEAAAATDLVVVNIHWGVPLGWTASHQNELADYQRPLAHAMVDAGASAIIGHGPHAIQSVEIHRGSAILYSIGNFIMHDILPETAASAGAFPDYEWDSLRTYWNSIGCIARLGWDRNTSLAACELIVTNLDARGESRLATRADAQNLRERLVGPCAKCGTEIELHACGPHWVLKFGPGAD